MNCSSDALNDGEKYAELSITYRFSTCAHTSNVPPIIGGGVVNVRQNEPSDGKLLFVIFTRVCVSLRFVSKQQEKKVTTSIYTFIAHTE